MLIRILPQIYKNTNPFMTSHMRLPKNKIHLSKPIILVFVRPKYIHVVHMSNEVPYNCENPQFSTRYILFHALCYVSTKKKNEYLRAFFITSKHPRHTKHNEPNNIIDENDDDDDE